MDRAGGGDMVPSARASTLLMGLGEGGDVMVDHVASGGGGGGDLVWLSGKGKGTAEPHTNNVTSIR